LELEDGSSVERRPAISPLTALAALKETRDRTAAEFRRALYDELAKAEQEAALWFPDCKLKIGFIKCIIHSRAMASQPFLERAIESEPFCKLERIATLPAIQAADLERRKISQ
jgi:hypothetical protein